jgi:transposase
MCATLLEETAESPDSIVSCEHRPTVGRLERMFGELRREVSELRCEVGYWKSRHADAVKRVERLKEELEQSRGEVRELKAKLFGRQSEKSSGNTNHLRDPQQAATTRKKRGAQPGHPGHRRRDHFHLPMQEEFVSLPEEARACPRCGKPAAAMSATEDSDVLEIEVKAYRRRIRRRRYQAACACRRRMRTLVAPPPPKLIPKGNYGISIWVQVLLDKYAFYRPTERLLGQLAQYGLNLSPGTVNAGLCRIEPLLRPVYEALCARNRQGEFHQGDETRWLVFARVEGKKGHCWWLWVVLAADTVVYLLDRSRGHHVPEAHFGPKAKGVLEVDRYCGYKAMKQVRSGRLLLSFCWAHVRRDFVRVGRSRPELAPWALVWLRRIREIYRSNEQRLCQRRDSRKFRKQDSLLRQTLKTMHTAAADELSDAKLRLPCRKALESLQEHWPGLVRFVDDPRIPLDNNASERAVRGPALARKNFYGSGSLWSGRLAATMFSLLATLKHWKLNPQRWLTAYLESCAVAGGKAPDDIQAFLPWNLSAERKAEFAALPPAIAADTS